VDNSVLAFGLHLDNGIPIVPFYNDPEDDEMIHLMKFLDSLEDFPDVREPIKKSFHLSEISLKEID
jgi:hypothetical protein